MFNPLDPKSILTNFIVGKLENQLCDKLSYILTNKKITT